MTQKQNQKILIFFLVLALFATISGSSFSAETSELPQRSDIDDKYKWNLEDIYADTAAWNKDYNYIKDNYKKALEFKGHLSDSPEMLYDCYQFVESLERMVGKLYVYAHMKLDEDSRQSQYQELSGRIQSLVGDVNAATSFMQSEITAMDNEKLMSFIDAKPELEGYRFNFEDMNRQKAHILSDKEESLLAMAFPMARTAKTVFEMLERADLKLGTVIDDDGNKIKLTWGRVSKIMEEGSRELRRATVDTLYSSYSKYINILAATLGGTVKKDVFFAKARNYESCLEASLDAYNIPTSVVHKLIEAVNNNLGALHKYTSLRKKVLGLDTLHTFDLSIPLAPKSTKEYTYEEAVEMVTNGLKPMGEEYLTGFKKGLSSGWVDVYETEGKDLGAYNWGSYETHPFILMNFAGNLDNIFTLAHEMGHAMHKEYTDKNEPFIYSGHSKFTAEVASSVNEAVLLKHLIANTEDKNEKLSLLEYYISQIRGSFFVQTMFTEFELAIHEHVENGGAVSVDYFQNLYRDIFKKYYGPDLYVGPKHGTGGMKISHLYSQYYVFQYSTSFAASEMISQRIIEGEDGIIDVYKEFLSTGRSKYPIDILKAAGVDFTKPETVDRTIKIFAELVDEMERLLLE